jgi:hypothetical protein
LNDKLRYTRDISGTRGSLQGKRIQRCARIRPRRCATGKLYNTHVVIATESSIMFAEARGNREILTLPKPLPGRRSRQKWRAGPIVITSQNPLRGNLDREIWDHPQRTE